MTKRVAGHLKRRLRDIESEISHLQFQIQASKQSLKIAEEDLFAYKVEHRAIQKAFDSWNIEQSEE